MSFIKIIKNCPKCGFENDDKNFKCVSCGFQFKPEKKDEGVVLNKKYYFYDTLKHIYSEDTKFDLLVNFTIILILLPGLILGLVLMGISIYNNYSEDRISKNYSQTSATLIEYENCKYENEMGVCAVYEYSVNGTIYKASPNFLGSNKYVFKKNINIKYNTNNPREYQIKTGWNDIFYIGLVIEILIIIIYIVIKLVIKKFKKKVLDN